MQHQVRLRYLQFTGGDMSPDVVHIQDGESVLPFHASSSIRDGGVP